MPKHIGVSGVCLVNMKNDKKTVIVNMFWRFAERVGAQGVSFVVSIILARLLTPESYGIVSLLLVFMQVLQIFVDSGFPKALLQKKDADQLDFSTVFYYNVVMGLLLYGLMFFAAPLIARFYQKEYLTPYIRVMSLTLIIGSVKSVQHVIVAKRMIFRKFFGATLTGTVVSAVIGILMAYRGFGAWAIIAQKLSNQLIDTFFLWFVLRWKPSPAFSFQRLKPLFRYGSRLVGSSLLSSLGSDLNNLVIGRFYSTAELAYYDKGRSLPYRLVEVFQYSAQSVLFPVLADVQDDRLRLRVILQRSVKTSAYCVFPCMMGLGVCATPLITLVYADKWGEMIPYFQVWCFINAFFLLHNANLQVVQAVGRSDTFLKIEIIKQTLSIVVLIVFVRFGVLTLLLSSAVLTVVSFCINAHPNAEFAGYGVLAQFRDLFPIILLNIAMGVCVYLVGQWLPFPLLPKLILMVLTGVIVYFGLSALFRVEAFRYLLQTVKSFRKQASGKNSTQSTDSTIPGK